MRGLIVGLQNMLEKPMLQDPTIRKAAADEGLGVVWIAPGSEGGKERLGLQFSPAGAAVATLHQVLNDLARESGYAEIGYAPLLVVGHSAAMPFVWGMAELDASRVFAILPYKGWVPGHAARSIPTLYVSSEWAEWGAEWGEIWRVDRAAVEKLRSESDGCLVGEFVDIGSGHFDWTPEAARVIALFIRKAARSRIPETVQSGQSVALKPIGPESGWLVDPATLGTDACKPVPYARWSGDRKHAFWFFDAEMAEAVNSYMAERLRKKPQAIDYLIDGKPAPLERNGFAEIGAKLLDDGVTFQIAATFLDKSPSAGLYNGAIVGHAAGPIQFRVASGALKQVGPATFRVWVDRGGVERQGPPWEPWVMAFQPGDGEYRATDRPAHIRIEIRNKDGRSQTIDFPQIADVPVGARSVKLQATAASGLPVQYFVISGPVELKGDTLVLQPIPPRSKFPMRVLVAAYQWGRPTEPKLQSAGPVVQEFFIKGRTQ